MSPLVISVGRGAHISVTLHHAFNTCINFISIAEDSVLFYFCTHTKKLSGLPKKLTGVFTKQLF